MKQSTEEKPIFRKKVSCEIHVNHISSHLPIKIEVQAWTQTPKSEILQTRNLTLPSPTNPMLTSQTLELATFQGPIVRLSIDPLRPSDPWGLKYDLSRKQAKKLIAALQEALENLDVAQVMED